MIIIMIPDTSRKKEKELSKLHNLQIYKFAIRKLDNKK